MLDDERVLPSHNNDIFRFHEERYKFACGFTAGKTVFSIACGVGYGEHMLATKGRARHVTGVDYSKEAIDFANEEYGRANLEFIAGDARDLGGRENDSYDIVVCFSTIEHLRDDRRFLGELTRLLKPSGLLLLSTTNKAYSYKSALSPRPLEPCHVREYRRRRFISLVEEYFGDIKLYGQKTILGRTLANLPRYLFCRFTGKLPKMEKQDFTVGPYPDDPRFAKCTFMAVCRKKRNHDL